MRRSPGGGMPRSRRSRPDDPPSSAMVTTAAGSTPSCRRAPRLTDRPCPPPSATGRFTGALPLESLTLHIAMRHVHAEAPLPQPAAQLVREHDAAVPAAGAADRHGEVVLALAHVAGQGDLQQRLDPLHEGPGAVLRQHIDAAATDIPALAPHDAEQ